MKTELNRLPQPIQNANVDVRLSSALMKLGTGARMEAIELVSTLLPAPPPTQTRRQAEVLRFLESWLMAESGHPHQAISILDVGPADDLGPASGSASGGLRSSWRQLQAACLFADGSPARIQAMLEDFATSSAEPYTRGELGAGSSWRQAFLRRRCCPRSHRATHIQYFRCPSAEHWKRSLTRGYGSSTTPIIVAAP